MSTILLVQVGKTRDIEDGTFLIHRGSIFGQINVFFKKLEVHCQMFTASAGLSAFFGMNSSSKKFRVQSVDSSVSSTYPSQCQGLLCRASSHQHASPTTVSRAIICQNSHPINAFDILSIILSSKWLVPTHHRTPTLSPPSFRLKKPSNPELYPPPTSISIFSAFHKRSTPPPQNFRKVVAHTSYHPSIKKSTSYKKEKNNDFVIHAKKRSQLQLPDRKI
ncbi:hypothetical protein NA56DRAFT_705968 [Hyaloscypha hepaticicola]|uniref:Uncharacterized protein n=1 Tax=Hyaloscypha hepaticicola TaxID=2082293 RepID=A0A2J6PY29_9HELO|nr:hypothetical protein NA56DRAFT_705968 [Hyaloscypha hepaticicola]